MDDKDPILDEPIFWAFIGSIAMVIVTFAILIIAGVL